MLNNLTKLFLGKEIILYNRHRQSIPIVMHPENRAKFIFIQAIYFWRLIPLRSNKKLKFRLMYLLLSCIKPKYILDINWISVWQSLYKVYALNHKDCKFIVVQHGSYVGGIITDIAHRYTKCDVFLCWGDYFKELFQNYNPGKQVKIISFGNPVYNAYSRDLIKAKQNNSNEILFLPSGITSDRMPHYIKLVYTLEHLGYKVYMKTHRFQGERNFPATKAFRQIQGKLTDILMNNNFCCVVSDHTSALIDAIFFKNRVLYFSPNVGMEAYIENIYSNFLVNIAPKYLSFKSKNELLAYVDIEKQEALLHYFYRKGSNNLSILNK